MIRLQTYTYQLKTNGTQERQLRQFAGSCRFVWNKALALQKERHEQGEKKLGYAGLCKSLVVWKSIEAPFLKESPSQPLQQTLKDLDRAYTNFFQKRAGFPRFKKKGKGDSFRYPDSKQFKIDQANSRISLPKLGWVRCRNSRTIEGIPKNVTVSRSGKHWFVSIQTEREVDAPVHASTSSIGVDIGIAKLAMLSDGTVFEPVNSFKRYRKQLARYQRDMARKKKFSNNWKKTRTKIHGLHAKIGNTRKDYLQKTTTTICKNHAIVCIEDVKVRNMSKSAQGTLENPGRNVKAKSGLNRSILNQGWFEFRRQLEYKQAWKGGMVVAVPARNTSRACSACGHVSPDNRKSQSRFTCTNCGFEINADVNAARNILAAGLAVLACGEMAQSGHSMNQEPAEAIRACA